MSLVSIALSGIRPSVANSFRSRTLIFARLLPAAETLRDAEIRDFFAMRA